MKNSTVLTVAKLAEALAVRLRLPGALSTVLLAGLVRETVGGVCPHSAPPQQFTVHGVVLVDQIRSAAKALPVYMSIVQIAASAILIALGISFVSNRSMIGAT